MIYPFVSHADQTKIENSRLYALHKRLEETGSYSALTEAEKSELAGYFSELWHQEAYRTGKYKVMGFVFDFTPWMKTYWVKTKYYGVREIHAFNKTLIRKNAVTPSHILKIVEIQ